MSNLARKVQEERQRQTAQKPVKKSKKKRSYGITLGEKIIGVLFITGVSFGCFQIVSNQAAIYQINKDIQEIRASIEEQERTNEDLKAQVNELSTYERIWAKAKELDLKFKDDNVKVVQKND